MYFLKKGLITLINTTWNYKTLKLRLISKWSYTIAIPLHTIKWMYSDFKTGPWLFRAIYRDENTHPHSHRKTEYHPTLKQPLCAYSRRSKAETKSKGSMMSGKAGPPIQVAYNYKYRDLNLQGLLCLTFIF